MLVRGSFGSTEIHVEEKNGERMNVTAKTRVVANVGLFWGGQWLLLMD